MANINVRYIVDDVDEAIQFYTSHLGFEVDMRPAPGFAALSRDNLTLLLNQPGSGGAGTTTSDGIAPTSGGWNRFQLVVDNLEAMVGTLREHGATFRNEMVKGKGGNQILLQDPSGNLIELFEPFEAST